MLENWEYLWFYGIFWVVISDGGLKLPKLSIHTLVMQWYIRAISTQSENVPSFEVEYAFQNAK